MKRILSVVLAISLVFAVLAGTGIVASAEEAAQTISEVVLDNVPVAEIDEDITGPEIPVDEDANYTAEANWYDEYYEPATGTFEEGCVYYLEIVLTAKEGYEFSEDDGVEAYINGEYYYGFIYSSTEAAFDIRYSFLEKIDAIEITGVVDAVVGETATVDDISVPEDANYYIDDASWYEYNGDIINGKTFEDKNKYELVISVLPNDGYEFDEYAVFTVNGEEVTDAYVDFDFADAWITYSFFEPIEKVTLPAFPEVTIGEEIEYTDEPVAEADEYDVYGIWSVLSSDGMTAEEFEGILEEGSVYLYYYFVEVHDGFTISDDTVFTVGNEQADSIFNQISEDWALISKMYNFSDVEEIKTIEITVPTPTIGEAVDQEDISVPEDADYVIDMFAWGESVDESILNSDSEFDKFEEGMHYLIAVQVSAKEGYVFAEDVVITLNGDTVKLTALDELGISIVPATPSSLVLIHSFGELTEDKTPEENPEEKPDENPDQTPDENPDQIPDEKPDQTPDEKPEETPDENLDDNADNNTDKTPGSTISPSTGEDLPITVVAIMLISAIALCVTVFIKKKQIG